MAVGLALAGVMYGQTYYVSPIGSDSNTGTSASSPWQTLTKVDSTTFAPGSQILFQAGSNWYGQQLVASSSGTTTAPITYGMYGTGADPTFWGSVPVAPSVFTPVVGTTDTYFEPTTTTINSFFVNQQFLHSAPMVSGTSTEAGNISYVESHANSWYYDSAAVSPGLYINTGSALISSNLYTQAVQQNVVYSNAKSNVIFENLNVTESAVTSASQYNGGYGFYADGGANVTFLNDTDTAAARHAFIAEDTYNFVGKNLSAGYLMPDQGYGAATAYVSYAGVSANTTYQWINDTSTNPNGSYPAFYTHETPSTNNPTPIAGILVQNMNTSGGPGIAISTAGNEVVTIDGGHVDGGTVNLYGNNITVSGLLMSGAQSQFVLDGSGNIVQNSIISGESYYNGAIVDAGTGNIIRYNTISLGIMSGAQPANNAAIALANNNTGTQIYGNIIVTTSPGILLQSVSGTPTIQAFDNLVYSGAIVPEVIFGDGSASIPFSSLPTSVSYAEVLGNPQFVNASAGDFSLSPGSIAAYVFDPTTGEYVMYDYYGNLRPGPGSLDSLGAIEVPEPASLELLAASLAPTLMLAMRAKACR